MDAEAGLGETGLVRGGPGGAGTGDRGGGARQQQAEQEQEARESCGVHQNLLARRDRRRHMVNERTPGRLRRSAARNPPVANRAPTLAGTRQNCTARRMAGDGPTFPDVDDPILRAQIAAFSCRSMPFGGNPGDRSSGPNLGPNLGQQWDDEDHGKPFSDRNGVDDALWRNVGTLAFYGVAHGYPDGTFDPTGQVLRVQAISLITRAMVTKDYWVQATADDASIYPNVPASSGHRLDLATYARNAGDLPGRPRQQPWAEWADPAPRGWLVQVLWQALDSFWRQTCAP